MNEILLRDYLIAHAPVVPQTWFKPDMPEQPPTMHGRLDWHTEYHKQLYIQWPSAWADEQLKARGRGK